MLYFPVITVSKVTSFLPSFVVWYTYRLGGSHSQYWCRSERKKPLSLFGTKPHFPGFPVWNLVTTMTEPSWFPTFVWWYLFLQLLNKLHSSFHTSLFLFFLVKLPWMHVVPERYTQSLSLDSINSKGISYELISLEGLVLSLATQRWHLGHGNDTQPHLAPRLKKE